MVTGFLIGALGGGLALSAHRENPNSTIATTASPPASRYAHEFSLCFTGGGTNCVVDGDTFWNEGIKIRVADIDAPETHPPRCEREADLGRRATLRLQELLNQGPFELQTIDRDKDRYGRILRIATRGGQSLGMQLVNEGLARKWIGHREPWC